MTTADPLVAATETVGDAAEWSRHMVQVSVNAAASGEEEEAVG